jgi:hypothetical protein
MLDHLGRHSREGGNPSKNSILTLISLANTLAIDN